MFKKILIANRGEIACRIIRTAQEMGIHTIAIFSDADRDSFHVQLADSAFYVGEAAAKESYLNIESILKAAVESGAEAIHPGYGFLSENAAFAEACDKAGIIFIGPSTKAINLMASKQRAKQLLEATGVPLTPGYHGDEQTETRLLQEANKIGFPVLIKAANGGGGKGMRAVQHEQDFASALAAAKRESISSFANDDMIIEKLVSNPRHIEVQIMADNHGNIVHLFERDCSIQRRHQKIIEEAPANITSTLRSKITHAACEVARHIDYRGAGTVEFLVGDQEQFYFMEMNTRLQVEHPITEMITQQDLVCWQLKIAANEPLPLQQEDIKIEGHAIECRIYAEDPSNNFIPSIGIISTLIEPQGKGIRIDSGIKPHSEISKYYDPMISKLIVWSTNREQAISRMQNALSQYRVCGIKTNIPFLQAICSDPDFVNQNINTDFLVTHTIDIKNPPIFESVAIACCYEYLKMRSLETDPIFVSAFNWQSLIKTDWLNYLQHENTIYKTSLSIIKNNEFHIAVNDRTFIIQAEMKEKFLEILLHQRIIKVFIEENYPNLTLHSNQGSINFNRVDFAIHNDTSSEQEKSLASPMPSTIVSILKNIGDPVAKGEALIILEAMKMEHTIYAPYDGVITQIFFRIGEQVMEGRELIALNKTN